MEFSTDDQLFSEILKALSNPIRVKILQLCSSEISQQGLAQILHTSASCISINTDILSSVGLVEIIRKEEGKKYVRSCTDRIILQILPIATTVGICD